MFHNAIKFCFRCVRFLQEWHRLVFSIGGRCSSEGSEESQRRRNQEEEEGEEEEEVEVEEVEEEEQIDIAVDPN